VAVGYQPENGISRNLRIWTPPAGCRGREQRHSHPRFFAAGDCRAKTVRQLTTAVGDGAAPAVAAVRYIDGL
jgi:thioredoxin reductase (NADPH)